MGLELCSPAPIARFYPLLYASILFKRAVEAVAEPEGNPAMPPSNLAMDFGPPPTNK